MKNQSGFTLIEMLLYLGLFAIVIGGGMVAVYAILEGTAANKNQTIVQEEGNFLLRKIEWALNGATSITIPSALSPYSDTTLIVTKDIAGSPAQLTFDLNAGNLTLQQGSGSVLQINSNNVAVSLTLSGHLFQRSIVSGKPDAIIASFTLTSKSAGRPFSQNFSTTKYLRQ